MGGLERSRASYLCRGEGEQRLQVVPLRSGAPSLRGDDSHCTGWRRSWRKGWLMGPGSHGALLRKPHRHATRSNAANQLPSLSATITHAGSGWVYVLGPLGVPRI
eukprot:617696-Prorocentrum_minimum.AAC.4